MISSLADRLLARLVPNVSAAAEEETAQSCEWVSCGYACVSRFVCCIIPEYMIGCFYVGPCEWTC
jgi:hypothetical protein